MTDFTAEDFVSLSCPPSAVRSAQRRLMGQFRSHFPSPHLGIATLPNEVPRPSGTHGATVSSLLSDSQPEGGRSNDIQWFRPCSEVFPASPGYSMPSLPGSYNYASSPSTYTTSTLDEFTSGFVFDYPPVRSPQHGLIGQVKSRSFSGSWSSPESHPSSIHPEMQRFKSALTTADGNIGCGWPSNEISYLSHAVDDPPHQQSWSPVCLSSPSASTEYLSNGDYESPYAMARSGFGTPQSGPQIFQSLPDLDNPLGLHSPSSPPFSPSFRIADFGPTEVIIPDKSVWCEKVTWLEPTPLEDRDSNHIIRDPEFDVVEDLGSVTIPDTPGEPSNTVSQDQVDCDVLEMTCGPKVEEHFWPLRYQIRHGKFDNSIQALVVHARKLSRPGTLSILTRELVSHQNGSTLGLTFFLDESQSRRERLVKIASEIGGTGLQRFKEAMWEDSLMIMLVFYEILTSKADIDDIMKLRGNKAQFILDLMQDAVRTHIDFMHIIRGGAPRMRSSRKIFLKKLTDLGLLRNVGRASAQLDACRLLVRLSEACHLLPSSLALSGVDEKSPNPLFGGTFGDIYTAQYQGELVALKRLRIFQADSEEIRQTRRKFCREALIWKNLDHDYVLPFWGSIVSVRGKPEDSAVPVLMYEIAMGLQYLHSQNIVHGDLRGANILLDDGGHARLADFGLTVFVDGQLAPTSRGGSTRWMAPELLNPESCALDTFQRTLASDLYSFACVGLELYTGKPPFSDLQSDGAVLLKVIAGERPAFPAAMPDWCSQLIVKCWSQAPLERPGTGSIIEYIVRAVRKRPRSWPKDYSSSEAPASKRRRFQEVLNGS
ncbi:kinase-like domain-containing protein [Mycena crocata]|nr:kinase-like domain-containing protein [Mycena crocata]